MEGCSEKEEVLPLIEKLNELQAENTGLRDRNDELTMEVEALTAKLASLKTRKYVDNVQSSLMYKTLLSISFKINGIWARK
jgi:predicted nuclease with TOPRIM domain